MNLVVAYSCNENYIQQTGISMISLLENNRNFEGVTIYFIYKDVSNSSLELLRSICLKYERVFIDIPFEKLCYDLDITQIGRHIETIYTKVFFSRIVGLEKVIYLDSDTIVVNSLSDLWNTSLDGCYMGVVETLTKFKSLLDIPLDQPFFNDGVVLVNVKYCRENNLIEKIFEIIKEFNGNPPVLSEGALNKACLGRVKYLSLRFNLMAGILYLCRNNVDYLASKLHSTKEDLMDSCNHPVIIHFLSAFYSRPWYISCTHPYKAYYLKYKKISPWKNLPLQKGKLPLKILLIHLLIKFLGYHNFDKLRFYLIRS